MSKRLLVKNILCALSIGVVISCNAVDTAFANEKNDNEIRHVDKVNVQQEQLEQIQQLSKDIADMNIRLNQLTESLKKYNESLKQDNEEINIVKNKKEFSSKDIEEFNNNRKLDKNSRIIQENESDWQRDFNKDNILDISENTRLIDEKNIDKNKEIIKDMEQDEFNDVISDFEIRDKQNKINHRLDDKNKSKNIVKIENNYVVNMESSNISNLDSMNMLDRFNSKAPLWTYEYFERLLTKGLLYPDEDFNLNALTRREAAILTARSYNLNKIEQRRQEYETNIIKQEDEFTSNDIDVLMREFYPEVKALGYDIVSELTNTGIQYKQDYKWKIGGEIRYDYAKNSGSPKYEWNDSRLRIRLYGEKALSKDWILHTMLESDKSFIDDSVYTQERDGDIDLNRLYLETNQEWWGVPFSFELGKTYAYLGDGNVLDSDFKGIKISAEATQNTNYSLGYGEVNDSEDLIYAEILNQNKDYNYLAGIYKWDNYGNSDTIKAFGMNYYIGNYTLGGMYLASNLKDGSGANDGYVLSARYGRNIPWISHTFEFDIKYYNMAGNTYINHTMSGLGGYMDGFSGWGTMAYYTLVENLVLGLEYYDLEDKTTSEKGKTVWASLIYGF